MGAICSTVNNKAGVSATGSISKNATPNTNGNANANIPTSKNMNDGIIKQSSVEKTPSQTVPVSNVNVNANTSKF